MKSQYAIELKNITKKFGKIIANNNINLRVKHNEIHAIIGENGAGKSTLMSILFGILKPDLGGIYIDGVRHEIQDPKHANKLGIGMVHQHFKLIEIYDAVDNIILGKEPRKINTFTDKKNATKKIKELSKKFHLPIDFKKKVKDMSVGMQQKIEIMKMLYTDSKILIFDEPTAVLTPQEIEGFLDLLKTFKKNGKTIILITHKLNEVKAVADNATIIRKGETIKEIVVKTTSTNEMASLMVGRKLVEVKNKFFDASKEKKILDVKNLIFVDKKTNKRVLDNISFEIKKGEIVALAGIEGNGQSELANIISGILIADSGQIILDDYDISNISIRRRYEKGLSHVPEDRHKYGLLLDMMITDNMVSQLFYKLPFSHLGILNPSPAKNFTLNIIQLFDVRGANEGFSLAKGLSGGNQQKAIIGREMEKKHKLFLAVQPTRGLDLGAIEKIHNAILNEKKRGIPTLLISYELDEVLALADRILVINKGKITGNLLIKNATRKKVGELMTAH